MVIETKTRATKRKTDNLNPGKGAKALKGKKEDAKVDDLTTQFKELKEQNEILMDENKKLKVQLRQFQNCSKPEAESSGSQTDFTCFSASCVRTMNDTCDFYQDLSCVECEFEASSKNEFNWHMNANHGWPSQTDNEEEYDKKIICNMCGEILDTKGSLMRHRKEMHLEEVKLCSFFVDGNCDYPDDACWYIHDKKKAQQQKFKCNLCEKVFKTKFSLMHHKKECHDQSVPLCKGFQNGFCRFEGQTCWYKHNQHSTRNKSEMTIQTSDNNEDMFKRLFDMMEKFAEKMKTIESSIERNK